MTSQESTGLYKKDWHPNDRSGIVNETASDLRSGETQYVIIERRTIMSGEIGKPFMTVSRWKRGVRTKSYMIKRIANSMYLMILQDHVERNPLY
jgi:hypothetical protein